MNSPNSLDPQPQRGQRIAHLLACHRDERVLRPNRSPRWPPLFREGQGEPAASRAGPSAAGSGASNRRPAPMRAAAVVPTLADGAQDPACQPTRRPRRDRTGYSARRHRRPQTGDVRSVPHRWLTRDPRADDLRPSWCHRDRDDERLGTATAPDRPVRATRSPAGLSGPAPRTRPRRTRPGFCSPGAGHDHAVRGPPPPPICHPIVVAVPASVGSVTISPLPSPVGERCEPAAFTTGFNDHFLVTATPAGQV